MKILKIDSYRDGGSISVQTDEGEYVVDRRIGTETPGALWRGYPEAEEGYRRPASRPATLHERRIIFNDLGHLARFALLAQAKGVHWDEYGGDVVLPEPNGAE